MFPDRPLWADAAEKVACPLFTVKDHLVRVVGTDGWADGVECEADYVGKGEKGDRLLYSERACIRGGVMVDKKAHGAILSPHGQTVGRCLAPAHVPGQAALG